MKPAYIVFAVNKEDQEQDLAFLANQGNNLDRIATGYIGSYKGETEASYIFSLFEDVTILESEHFLTTLSACDQESILLVSTHGDAYLMYLEDIMHCINTGDHWLSATMHSLGVMTEVSEEEAKKQDAYTYQEVNSTYYIADNKLINCTTHHPK